MLVTTALSVVMLLVLSSLASSKVVGIREWGQANALAVISLLLFASRGVLPDLLSLELANAMLLATIALMYVGFRRHLGLAVPVRALVLGGLAAFCALVVFHDVHESLSLRITSVSAYHASVCFAIYRCVPKVAEGRLRYPFTFTRITAFALGCGHAFRGSFYAVDAWAPITSIDPATINIAFVAIGTLAMPALTLGAVMMSNARVLSETAYAAEHDHLTGAPSRRAFFEAAERELARAQRHGSGLGLLLIDADHFKRINDTYGHGVGDQVLRDLVQRTQEVIRKIDYCARLGGEEFGVLLPEATRETALAVAERLRSALDRSTQAEGAAYTVSIGLAMLEEGKISPT
ncbi:diguanylate cyclase [Massilia sp. 9I]|uniref:GGDEF domain-containing protein n=1 Tax=Massilia sp. 9I TaxID=2653152 RepID=UPI001359B83A|nr:GGDEF domain-containing protein [Massilia sp. 9I]